MIIARRNDACPHFFSCLHTQCSIRHFRPGTSEMLYQEHWALKNWIFFLQAQPEHGYQTLNLIAILQKTRTLRGTFVSLQAKTKDMKMKPLGKQGLQASEIGLGCMGMSDFYGKRDDETSADVIRRAFDLGITFFDTADMYGPYTNEILVGKAIKGFRDKITLATKFGIVRD